MLIFIFFIFSLPRLFCFIGIFLPNKRSYASVYHEASGICPVLVFSELPFSVFQFVWPYNMFHIPPSSTFEKILISLIISPRVLSLIDILSENFLVLMVVRRKILHADSNQRILFAVFFVRADQPRY